MARSQSPISGPFLELSTANLHLNELSVDQLAALWNVFTKVGDSLHKGRRLENFVWRAWHREAHLLPPDASWSDFADCTPLETPVLSRAGSISQSYHLKPAVAQALAAAAATASTSQSWTGGNASENVPSDPESGAGWSDESSSDDDEEEDVQRSLGQPSSTARGQMAQRSTIRSKAAAEAAPSPLPPASTQTRHSRKPSRTPSDVTCPPQGHVASPAKQQSRPGTGSGLSHLPHERKRNSSTSSAFGSRSRVRHLNPGNKPTRRSPISFQAALESLTNGTESDDLARLAREHQNRGLGSAYERRSFQGTTPIDVLAPSTNHTHGLADQQQQQADEAAIAAATASHSSAPAASAFEARSGSTQGSTADGATGSNDVPSASAAPLDIKVDDTAVDSKARAGETRENNENKGKKAKFFLSTSASRSYGDDDAESVSAASVSPAPPPVQQQVTTSPSSQAPTVKTEPPVPHSKDSADASAATPPLKQAKPKTEARPHLSGGLTAAHKNRSGAALHKHGPGASRTRLAHGHHGRQGSSSRLGAAAGLTMTKTQAAATAAPPKGASNAKSASRARPKFTMGGGDDDDEADEEEFTDDDNAQGTAEKAMSKATRQAEPAQSPEASATKAPLPPKDNAQSTTQPSVPPSTAESKQPLADKGKRVEIVAEKGADVEDDDEEGWSSDTSAEAEEERQRVEAEALRRRRADEERQRDLFKKVPVRSASAADVRHLNPDQHGSSGGAQPQRTRSPQPVPEDVSVDANVPHPIRGLLSSLFHPEQESRSPPGQLHGRPHASAADLRVKPDRPPSRVAHKSERRHRPPSLISGTPSTHHHHHAQSSHKDDGSEKGSQDHEEGGGGLRMSKSAVALPVLNTAGPMTGGGADGLSAKDADELLRQQQQQQPGGSGTLSRAPMRRGHSSQGSEDRRQGRGTGHDEARRVSPPQAPQPMAAPTLSAHRAGLPTPAAPQSPRTTRRNMLRDELSESLRQNLLWERQSRNRMLGIGANGPREAPPPQQPQQQQQQQSSGSMNPPPRPARRETVLGGNQLRPLTRAPATTSAAARSGSAGDEEGRRAPGASTRGEQHSRSTSHLSDMSSSAHTRGGSTSSSQQRRLSQPYSSNETSEDEDEDSSRAPSRQGERERGNHDADVPSSSTSSASTLREPGGEGHQPHKAKKKTTMWPGGFPNYHQHGW